MGVDVEQPSVELTMQRYIAFAIKEISKPLLYGVILSNLLLNLSFFVSSILYASWFLRPSARRQSW